MVLAGTPVSVGHQEVGTPVGVEGIPVEEGTPVAGAGTPVVGAGTPCWEGVQTVRGVPCLLVGEGAETVRVDPCLAVEDHCMVPGKHWKEARRGEVCVWLPAGTLQMSLRWRSVTGRLPAWCGT